MIVVSVTTAVSLPTASGNMFTPLPHEILASRGGGGSLISSPFLGSP